jgi:hypothetical protein
MPHADTSLVPKNIQTKSQFWEHVYIQLQSLLDGQRNWVCGGFHSRLLKSLVTYNIA